MDNEINTRVILKVIEVVEDIVDLLRTVEMVVGDGSVVVLDIVYKF
jgi:hypothetical protein